MKRNWKAAWSLFVLSPLIAEYLLGSLPMQMITILPLMAMLYGSGAILVREYVRRANLGWPALLLLATAYGLTEEGLISQSLFNPNYLHLRLLDYGWIPALGTSPVWVVYVIGIHVFWSISVPIGLTESLFPEARDRPWLGWFGVTVFALLLILAAVATGRFTYKQLPFMASPVQLGSTVTIIVALIAAARFFPRREAGAATVPSARVIFGAAVAAGSAFMAVRFLADGTLHLSGTATTAGYGLVLAAFLAFILGWCRGRRWSALQRFALAAGGVAAYGWAGFPIDISLHGTGSIPAHIALAAAIGVLTVYAGRRSARAA
jgi:hypothetical protein